VIRHLKYRPTTGRVGVINPPTTPRGLGKRSGPFSRNESSAALIVVPFGPTDLVKESLAAGSGDSRTRRDQSGAGARKACQRHRRDVKYKGHVHRATTDEPQYEIKRDKTDHVALRKAAVLRRLGWLSGAVFRKARWQVWRSHSSRTGPIGDFIALLAASEVGLVIDVRTVPRSRTNPQYDREALPGHCRDFTSHELCRVRKFLVHAPRRRHTYKAHRL
jgi:hypothetical protein